MPTDLCQQRCWHYAHHLAAASLSHADRRAYQTLPSEFFANFRGKACSPGPAGKLIFIIFMVDVENPDQRHDDVPLAPRNQESPIVCMPNKVSDVSAAKSAAILSVFYSVFYCIASLCMVAVNKAVVSNYKFSFTCFLLLLQSTATLVIAQFLGLRPKFNLQIARKLVPLSLIYLANVTVGLLAVRLLSIPVYTVIKRLTPLPTLILDYALRSKRQSKLAVLGVVMLVLGPILLAHGDLDFDIVGYLVGLGAVGMQAFFLIAVSWSSDSGTSELCLSWYNSLLTIPPLAIAVIFFEEDAFRHQSWAAYGFVPVLVLFSVLGAVFLFSTILLTSRCSALSLTVVGQVKGLLQIYMGFLWFGEVRLLKEGFLGIALSTAGAAVYAYAKFKS